MKKGATWERRLMFWHAEYRRDRRAFVVKCNPPVYMERGCLRWAGKGPPDFIGVAGGRAVCFEAKDCSTGRWVFRDGRGSVAPHQAKALEAAATNGGLAFVALRMGRVGWVIPWTMLGPIFWDEEMVSISAKRISEIGIRMTDDGWIDWAEAQ